MAALIKYPGAAAATAAAAPAAAAAVAAAAAADVWLKGSARSCGCIVPVASHG